MLSKQNYEDTVSVTKEGKDRFVKVEETAARPSSSSSSIEEEGDQYSIATEIIATTTVGKTRNDKNSVLSTHILPSVASSLTTSNKQVIKEEDDQCSIATEIFAAAAVNVQYDTRNDANVMSTPRQLSTKEVLATSVQPTAEEEKDMRDYIMASSSSCCAVNNNGVLCGCGEEGREAFFDVVGLADITKCSPEFVPEWGIGDGVKDAEVELLQTFGVSEKVKDSVNNDDAAMMDASKKADNVTVAAADQKDKTVTKNEEDYSIVTEAAPQMNASYKQTQDGKENAPSEAAAGLKQEYLATKETVPQPSSKQTRDVNQNDTIQKSTKEEDAPSESDSYSCTGEELKSIVLQNLSQGYESVVKVTEQTIFPMVMTSNHENESIVKRSPKTNSEQIAEAALQEDDGKLDETHYGANSIVFDNLSRGYESAVKATEKNCILFKDDLSKGYESAVKATEAKVTLATNEIESIVNGLFPMLTSSKKAARDVNNRANTKQENTVVVADKAQDVNNNPITKQSDTKDHVAIISDLCCSCTDDSKEPILSADQLKSNLSEYILKGYNSAANATNATIRSFSQPNDEVSSNKKNVVKTKIGDAQKKKKESSQKQQQQQQQQRPKTSEKLNRVEQQQKLEAYLQSLADHAIKAEKAATAQQEESKLANKDENDDETTGSTTACQGKLEKALYELRERRKSSSVEKLEALLNTSGGSSPSIAAFQQK